MENEFDIDGLVDTENGVISRELFVNRDLFDRELDRVFARAWLLVGHEGLVPNPDDYFVSRMGKDSVILTRNRQGEILVLLNSCPHRGMKVCRYDQGNAPVFTCPYHGWSFSTNRERVDSPGALVGVPRFEEGYSGQLDREKWGLPRCPNVVNYKGSIWASWDPDAPAFEDYLGDMKLYLDTALDHRDGTPGGSEILGGVQKWRVRCNWKTVSENFAGDLYHEVSHISANLAEIGMTKGKGRREALPLRYAIGFDGLGHGGLGFPPSYEERPFEPGLYGDPEIDDYFRDIHAARVRNLGDRLRVGIVVGTIFPNMSFHADQPRSLLFAHPVSATEVELWRMYLVDADAPQSVKNMLRQYYLRYSGPGGMTEADDIENWTSVTTASEGAIARRYGFNYQLGLGKEQPVEGLRGAVQSGHYSEGNARIYYRRWAQFMKGDSWADMMPGRSDDR
ncbi:MAG: Rieske 2Fe-2S domain-containing protein [Alphaproteobacteria bacterium]|nr:Rieske 2Fe-2S domain-containing protein [Alphaproteobacteria bacterium]